MMLMSAPNHFRKQESDPLSIHMCHKILRDDRRLGKEGGYPYKMFNESPRRRLRLFTLLSSLKSAA